jgi:hypothetical protein
MHGAYCYRILYERILATYIRFVEGGAGLLLFTRKTASTDEQD